MTQKFENNLSVQLIEQILSTDGLINLTDTSIFPNTDGNDFFLITLFKVVNGVETDHEIIRVEANITAIDQLNNLTRGMEGTTAKQFEIGDHVEMRVTKGSFNRSALETHRVSTTINTSSYDMVLALKLDLDDYYHGLTFIIEGDNDQSVVKVNGTFINIDNMGSVEVVNSALARMQYNEMVDGHFYFLTYDASISKFKLFGYTDHRFTGLFGPNSRVKVSQTEFSYLNEMRMFASSASLYFGMNVAPDASSVDARNTVMGNGAGFTLDGGESNTFYGVSSGSNILDAGFNSCFGRAAGSDATSGDNCTLVGYNAQKSTNTVSNEITLGNANVTKFRCQVSLTVLSDERDKTDIDRCLIGLDFIMDLNPKTYRMNNRSRYKYTDESGNDINNVNDGSLADKNKAVGFLAQDLVNVIGWNYGAQDLGLVNGTDDQLEVTYQALIPVMINAIQELKKENESLEERITRLEALVEGLSG